MLRKTIRKRRKKIQEEVNKLDIRKNYPSPDEVKRNCPPGGPAYFANLQKDDNWYNTKEN